MRLLLGGVLLSAVAIAFAAEFVPGIAVRDAGRIADAEAPKMYAFYIPAGTAPESVATTIQKNLTDAAKAKAALAIIGPDFSLNAKILGGVLQTVPNGSLQGATILYVNGGEDVEELAKAAAAAGATFRSTKYSGK